MITRSKSSFSLAIHGGAGASPKQLQIEEPIVRESMRVILEQGREMLEGGASALDTVQHCVRLLEDDPLFNAGHGGISNADGKYELDAAIMDGKTVKTGAVAAVHNVRNPIDLARLVMDKTDHVMIVAEGALRFAKDNNIPIEDDAYFDSAHEKVEQILQHTEEHGTVGAVSRDLNGDLAAATSTAGWETKMPGRVGDTPIIGAGTYADNVSCAMSCTGKGEDFIRTTLAARAAMMIEREKMDAAQAATQTIKHLVEKINGVGGFILIDKDGNVATAQSSDILRTGWIEHGGETVTTLQAPIRVARNETA